MDSGIKASVSLTLQKDSPFTPFRAERFEAGLQWAERLGFDGVELIINRPEEVDGPALFDRISRHGLTVSTIATGQMMGDGIIFCSGDKEIRKAAVERINRHTDLSAELGFPHVTVGLARGKGSPDPQERIAQRRLVAECLKYCSDYAAGKNVRINLEPINRYETFLLNSVKDTAAMIDEIQAAPVVGILYDTFHSNMEDADMFEAIRRYGGNFSHVHFADSNRMVPGNGHIDFAGVVSALRGVGYGDFVSLECLNLPDETFVLEHASAVCALARAAM